MSDFPRLLAVELGVTRRQVTRLCAARKIPGAYRTKGGHWRLRKLQRRPKCDARIAGFIDRYTSDGGYYEPSEFGNLIAIATKRLKRRRPDEQEFITVAKGYYLRLPKCNRPSVIMRPLDPEDPICQPAREAIRRQGSKLHVMGEKLRQLQREVTPATLARELHISVATLYRQYGQPLVNRVCEPRAVRSEEPEARRYQL